MVVVRFDLLVTFTSLVYNTFSVSDLQVNNYILSFSVYQQIAYVCDPIQGVFLFSITSSLKTQNSKPSLITIFEHPLYFGNLTTCTVTESNFAVGTENSILIYTLPYLNFLQVFSGNTSAVQANTNYTVAYTNNNRLLIYNNYLPIAQSLISDTFFESDSWILVNENLVLSNYTHLVTFNINLPSLVFLPQYQNYEFTGTIVTQFDSYSIYVLGSSTSGFFDFRGSYPDAGYIQLTEINDFVFTSEYSLVLPLSNYFVGNNMVYDFSSSLGSTSVSLKYELQYSFLPSGMWTSAQSLPGYLVLVSSNNLDINQFSNFTSEGNINIGPANSNSVICSFVIIQTYVVIESYTGTGIMTYVNRDIFTLTNSLVTSQGLGKVLPSSKMIANAQGLFILRGNCVEIYSLQTTGLTNITQICGDSLNPQVSLNLIDMDFCNGLCLLDTVLGVLYFSFGIYNNFTILNLPRTSFTGLLSTSDFLIVLSKTAVYKISLASFLYDMISIPCSLVSASISLQFLSVQCSYIIIIDLYAEAYTAVYDQIESQGMFLISGNEEMTAVGFLIENLQVSVYTVGTYETSQYVPLDSQVSSI